MNEYALHKAVQTFAAYRQPVSRLIRSDFVSRLGKEPGFAGFLREIRGSLHGPTDIPVGIGETEHSSASARGRLLCSYKTTQMEGFYGKLQQNYP